MIVTGTEVSSPVLRDREEDWKKLRNALSFIKCLGGVSNKTCGGHIHIGANALGYDTEAWKLCFETYSEIEPLFYTISNRRGEKTRDGVITYAKEIGENVDHVPWYAIDIDEEHQLKQFARLITRRELYNDPEDPYYHTRYKGINLMNLFDSDKNTIEFRLFNGTTDYSILRENVLLAGSHIQNAKICSVDPKRKKAELDAFFMPDLEEKEKLIRYLDMIFDETSHKQIFYDRWSSKVGVCDYKSRTFGRQQKYKKQTKKENNERKKDSTAIFEKSSLSLPKVNADLHSVVDDNKEEEIDERDER